MQNGGSSLEHPLHHPDDTVEEPADEADDDEHQHHGQDTDDQLYEGRHHENYLVEEFHDRSQVDFSHYIAPLQKDYAL